jgi:hypothetical protein
LRIKLQHARLVIEEPPVSVEILLMADLFRGCHTTLSGVVETWKGSHWFI